MSFAHFRRIVVSSIFIIAIAVLALIIDAVVEPIRQLVVEQGAEGPFSDVAGMVGNVQYLLVGFLLIGVLLWILVGPVQRTRVEQEERRLRR